MAKYSDRISPFRMPLHWCEHLINVQFFTLLAKALIRVNWPNVRIRFKIRDRRVRLQTDPIWISDTMLHLLVGVLIVYTGTETGIVHLTVVCRQL